VYSFRYAGLSSSQNLSKERSRQSHGKEHARKQHAQPTMDGAALLTVLWPWAMAARQPAASRSTEMRLIAGAIADEEQASSAASELKQQIVVLGLLCLVPPRQERPPVHTKNSNDLNYARGCCSKRACHLNASGYPRKS
jgi:hypothetical protein